MSADTQARDLAVSELKLTTVSYPRWAAGPPRKTDHFYKAFEALKKITTSADLIDAIAEIKMTSATYPQWVQRVQNGAYQPADGSTTHWGRAFAALARIGTVPPVGQSGAEILKFLPWLTNPTVKTLPELHQTLKLSGVKNTRYEDMTATEPLPNGHPLWTLNGCEDLEFVRWYVHDMYYLHNTSTSSMPDLRAQGSALHDSTNVRLASYAVEKLGGVQWDHFSYYHGFRKLLFEGVLGWKIGGYGFHHYGGDGAEFLAAGFTMGRCGRSGATHSDEGLSGKVTYANGIFHNIPEYGLRHNEGEDAEVTLINCWDWNCGGGLIGGTLKNKVKRIGGGMLTSSPFVNEANGDLRIRPDHFLVNAADPAYMPAADAYGESYGGALTVGGRRAA